MKRYQNLILLALVVFLVAIPLWIVQKPEPGPDGAEVEIFSGADGQAEELVGTIAPSYKPWAKPFMEPASGEIESMLFALQAALGAGFIGYWLGSSVTRSRLSRNKSEA